MPSSTQLSHARVKMDALLMSARRKLFSSETFVMVSSDSSPQGGLDFFISVEDRVRNPGMIIDASPAEIAEWCLSDNMQSAVLPLCIVGSGNADLSAKYEALLHSALLDVGPDALSSYSRNIIGLCADYGVERHLTQAPPIDIQKVFHSRVANSRAWLQMHRRGFLDLQLQQDDLQDGQQAASPLPLPGQQDEQSLGTFDLSRCLFGPGVKHMLDNIEQDLLHALDWYPVFSEVGLQ